MTNDRNSYRVAFIGSVGVPNRYGGFEAFVEHCGPQVARHVRSVIVTCDSRVYADRSPSFHGMSRIFISVPANGSASIFHDLLAFFAVLPHSTHIIVLGVSGGPWFPLFRLVCSLFGKTLVVNIDGVEWMRGKFSGWKRALLRTFDWLAQRCAHVVVFDNDALKPFVLPRSLHKATMIAYSGDHVQRCPDVTPDPRRALTVCRIEPENNISMLLDGAMRSSVELYTIIGNWDASAFGRDLRAQYAGNPRARLLDPEYDPARLARERESAGIYLHGHSVGGTNPSLVEMLFYDARILCFDVPYHRATAADAAEYFSDATQLAALLDRSTIEVKDGREALRRKYSSAAIAKRYLDSMSRREVTG